MGNQFLLSSRTQLALALARLSAGTSALPLAWFLLHLDLFAPSRHVAFPTSWLFEERGSVHDWRPAAVCVRLERASAADEHRIVQLRIPGCDPIRFAYDSAGVVNGFTPLAWDCDPAFASGMTACPPAYPPPPPAPAPPPPPPPLRPSDGFDPCPVAGSGAAVATCRPPDAHARCSCQFVWTRGCVEPIGAELTCL